jgi:hypothetical protein
MDERWSIRWAVGAVRALPEPALPRRTPDIPGGMVPADDELLQHTLVFSGSWVSDDGQVTIRRAFQQSTGYSGARFVGHCATCARAGLAPPAGDPLSDVRAAAQFVAAHQHGSAD